MPKQYPAAFRAHAVNYTAAHLDHYETAHAAYQALGTELGVSPETLRRWIHQSEVDAGLRSTPVTKQTTELNALQSQIEALQARVAELEEANEVLKASAILFATELAAGRSSFT